MIVSSVDTSANVFTVNLASATGTTTVGFKNTAATADTTIVNAASNATVVLDNADATVATGTHSVNLQGATSRTGTADAVALQIKNGSGTSTAAADLQFVAADGTTTDATFEVANITVEGAASYVAVSDGGANFRTFNVSGNATADTNGYGLTLTEAANFAQARTIDASGMTGGGLNITTTLAQDVTFTGSAGNDRLNVTAGITNLNASDKLTFGNGTDTLALGTDTAIASYTATQLATINALTDLEKLEFTAAATTLAAADFTKVNEFIFSNATSTAALAVTKLETADKLVFSGDIAPAAAATSVAALTLTGNVVGQTASIKLGGGADITGGADSGTGSSDAAASAIVFGGNITKLVIESTGSASAAANTINGGSATGSGNAAASAVAIANGTTVQTVEITGSKDLTITGGTSVAGTSNTQGFSGAVNVDANTFTGKLTINGSASADIITGGSGDDTIQGMAGADTLKGNGGKDTFVYTTLADSLVAANDTIVDFTSGTDKIDVGATQLAAIASAGGLVAVSGATGGVSLSAALTAATTAAAYQPIANGAAVVTLTGTDAWAGTYLVIDGDGAQAAFGATNDLVVKLTGVTTLAVTDFV